MIHGQKKSDKRKGQEQLKEEKELSDKISSKMAEFFAIRKQGISQNKIPMLMEFTTILMQLCTGIPTILNFRRQLVEKILETQDPTARLKTLGGDIKLMTKIIQSDPKSYPLWSYRQWLVLKFFQIDPSIINKQKELCNMLLTADEKNFHVWNYRNWTNTVQMNIDTELEFTKSKINANPFNFSPYHFRSKYLIWKYSQEITSADQQKKQEIVIYGMPKDVFHAEMETVRTAIFLNPKQQAPWLYYSWLLKQLLPSLLLDFKPDSENLSEKYELSFSLKIKNLKDALQIPENFQAKITSESDSSALWTVSLKQPADRKVIQVRENINELLIENQSSGRRLIWTKLDSVQQIKEIYQAEEKFIQQVNESQENDCRFGWLQLLELYRSLLYLGVTSKDWQAITEKSLSVFEYLKDCAKGREYILKQKQEWQRLHESSNLSVVEEKLKRFRNQ